MVFVLNLVSWYCTRSFLFVWHSVLFFLFFLVWFYFGFDFVFDFGFVLVLFGRLQFLALFGWGGRGFARTGASDPARGSEKCKSLHV